MYLYKRISTVFLLFIMILVVGGIGLRYEIYTKTQIPTERKHRFPFERGSKHMDSPALFARYHNTIRTKENELLPAYKMGYKWAEWKKATAHAVQYRDKLDWQERGPGNVSGRTRGLLIDPEDTTNLTWFAGSVGGGVWRTMDGGEHWQNMTPDLPNLATSTLAMSKHNPRVIYVGTGEGFDGRMINGSGIWKSNDKGQTWFPLKATLHNDKFRNILRMVVNPKNENELVVCTITTFVGENNDSLQSYIFKSMDGGVSWKEVHHLNGTPIQQIVFTPGDFSTQYATVRNTGILKSTDAGDTWKMKADMTGLNIGRLELDVSPVNPNNIFISAEGFDGSQLFYSRDALTTFSTAIFNAGDVPDWLGGQGFYDNTVAAHPFAENKVWLGGSSAILELEISQQTDSVRVVKAYNNSTDFLIEEQSFDLPFAPLGLAKDLYNLLGYSTETSGDDIIDVVIRFGPEQEQKAHFMHFDENSQFDPIKYAHQYERVPFEAWDVTHNRQLMISVLDFNEDGKWNPTIDTLTDLPPEICIIHNIDYDDKEDTTLAIRNVAYKAQYYFYLNQSPDYGGSTDTFPAGTINIITGIKRGKVANFDAITDGYGQFGSVGSKGVHVDHHNLILLPIDSAQNSFFVLNANDGGVAFSKDNGATFKQTGDTFKDLDETYQTFNGYNVSQFYGVDKMNGGDRYVGGTQDNGSWVSPADADAIKSWVSAPSGDGFEAAWNYRDPNQILESSQFNTISKSTDGGQTWKQLELPVNIGPFITRIASSQLAPDLVFISSYSGLVKSTDFGDSWEVKTMPFKWQFSDAGPPIQISVADADVVWTGSAMSETSNVVVSKDAGESWSICNNYTQATLGALTGIATHPGNPSSAYILFSQADGPKVLKTTDYGQTWKDLSGFVTNKSMSSNGFPNVATYSLVVMPFDTNQIWVGTEIGLFETLDGGASWHYANNGCPAVAIYQMKVVNDQIVLATHGRGIWSVTLPQITKAVSPLPNTTLTSMAIIPNPLGEQSVIYIESKEAKRYELYIVSPSGQVARMVFSGIIRGKQKIVLARGNLPAGLYFLTAKAKDQILSKKFIAR